MAYFDHASTSLPKEARVVEAVVAAMGEDGGSPGRGGHAGARAADAILETARRRARALIGTHEGEVAFTLNATDALNLAIKGLLRPGDEVVSTQIEHNSVLRPLRGLQRRACLSLRIVPADDTGRVALDSLLAAVGPRTRLVVLSHASNVSGALQPVAALGEELRRRGSPARLLVDAAQTAGYRPLDEVSAVADAVAVSGHKGPGGPQGTGFLWRRPGLRLAPGREGGTGTDSQSPFQPQQAPHDLEAGTPNLPGLAGLSEAMRQILEESGLVEIQRGREQFGRRFLNLLGGLEKVRCWGPSDAAQRELVFPLRVDGLALEEATVLMEVEAGIRQRSGLHCSPGAHQALGTGPGGSLRWSFGSRPTDKDFERARDTLLRMERAFAP